MFLKGILLCPRGPVLRPVDWLYVPCALTLMKKTSKPNLQTLVDTLKVFNNVKETESSWAVVNTNIMLLCDLVQTRQDATTVLDTLHPLVQSAMLSDRSRLSGSTLLLLRTCAEKGANMNNYTYFLMPLFKLVNRPSKVFSQRAEEVLVLVSKLVNIDRHVALFKDMFRSANKLVRLAVVKVVKHSSHPDLKSLVERAQTDASAEVRSEAKSQYSPLKKVARTGDCSAPLKPIISEGTGERKLLGFPKGPEPCRPRELECIQRSDFAEKTSAGQRLRAPVSTSAVRLGGLSRLHASRKRGLAASTTVTQGRPTQDGDNLTPNTLSRYLKNYQKSVLNKEAEASLLHKIKRREETMKEFTSCTRKPGTESCKDTDGSSCVDAVSPSLRASVARLLGERDWTSDEYRVPHVPQSAAAQKKEKGLAYDNPGLRLFQDLIWVSSPGESAVHDAPCKTSSRDKDLELPSSPSLKTHNPCRNMSAAGSCGALSASVGLFSTDIQTLIDGMPENASACEVGDTDELGESFVCFLLKTGDKLSETPDTAAEGHAREEISSLEACAEENTCDAFMCAESSASKVSENYTETAPVAQCTSSFQKTQVQAENLSLAPSADVKLLEYNAQNTTVYEDMPFLDMSEQLSCDISRMSLNETEVNKTAILVQCTSVDVPEYTSEQSPEKGPCSVPYVSSMQLHETVCIDCAEDASPASFAASEISFMENAGSSTEFTEIDSVIFVNKKTMAKK